MKSVYSWLESHMVDRKWSVPTGALVIALLAIVTGTRWLIDRGTGGFNFSQYFPVIFISAMLLGWRYSILAAAGSIFFIYNFFLDSSWFDLPAIARMLIALVFALTVVIITVLSHLVRELVREKEDRALQVRNYNDELQHRSTNMVQILVNWIELGLKKPDPAEYFAGLSDKLIAWSRSNAILQHSLAGEFNFADVVELACRPFDHGRIARQGLNPEIGASAARAVVLAIHELATNATKHGALSIPSGHVQMSWEPVGDDTVRVQWLEHGRPATFTPDTAGSGLRFLATLTDLHHFQIAPTPQGIMCTFEILQVRDPDRFAT